MKHRIHIEEQYPLYVLKLARSELEYLNTLMRRNCASLEHIEELHKDITHALASPGKLSRVSYSR